MGRGISKDAVFQKLWTIACYDNDSYVKEDWKALERIVWDGIKAQEGLITVRHQCDQYDARRRESIAKFEKLKLEHQQLKQEVDAFKALIGYEKGDGEDQWKKARANAFDYARRDRRGT